MKTLDYFETRSTKDAGTGCWLWAGALHRDGYGEFSDTGRTSLSHRGAWEAAHGSIPEGIHVCHRCDVRRCVNPAHLFLGTNADNVRDKVSKGRQSRLRGSHHGRAKLTEHDVRIIKMLLNLGVQSKRLATLYGVSKSGIGFIKTGQHWAHVAPLEGP